MSASSPQQGVLFDAAAPPARLPEGFCHEDGFLAEDEERGLIQLLDSMPFEPAVYKGYLARRKVVSYGGRFDYDSNELLPAAALAPALMPLRERVAAWMGVAPKELVHALLARYEPGTPLGWHRDVQRWSITFRTARKGV